MKKPKVLSFIHQTPYIEENCEVFHAYSIEEGLRILGAYNIDLIISNQPNSYNKEFIIDKYIDYPVLVIDDNHQEEPFIDLGINHRQAKKDFKKYVADILELRREKRSKAA